MSYEMYAKHKCGDIVSVPANNMDFLTHFVNYCPKCGVKYEFRDFETFVGHLVWKAVWYKPWTWLSFKIEPVALKTKQKGIAKPDTTQGVDVEDVFTARKAMLLAVLEFLEDIGNKSTSDGQGYLVRIRTQIRDRFSSYLQPNKESK